MFKTDPSNKGKAYNYILLSQSSEFTIHRDNVKIFSFNHMVLNFWKSNQENMFYVMPTFTYFFKCGYAFIL